MRTHATFTLLASLVLGTVVPTVGVPFEFNEGFFVDVVLEELGPLDAGTNTITGQLVDDESGAYTVILPAGGEVVSFVVEFSTDFGFSTLGTTIDSLTSNFTFSDSRPSNEALQSFSPPLLPEAGEYRIALDHNPGATEQIISYRMVMDVVITGGSQPPDCSQASLDVTRCWPPNHKFRLVQVAGVVDPDGDEVSITVTEVTQDEPVLMRGRGSGRTCPDAVLVDLDGDGTADAAGLRCERDGTGDGRVYTVWFTASDSSGSTCEGWATFCVPHDRRPGADCVDDGHHFDSTACTRRRGARASGPAGVLSIDEFNALGR